MAADFSRGAGEPPVDPELHLKERTFGALAPPDGVLAGVMPHASRRFLTLARPLLRADPIPIRQFSAMTVA